MTMRFGGCLIALEGIDRAGKSSVARRVPALLGGCRRPVVSCAERQSPIGEYLEPGALRDLTPFLKAYLFAADRAFIFERRCLPALKGGSLVVWDRYVASALAYRAVDLVHGHELFDMKFVQSINQPFPEPDLTVLIDVSPECSEERATHEGRVEPYPGDYLRRVRQAYAELLRRLPSVAVNGEQDPDEVARQVAKSIKGRFPEFFDES